MKTILFFCFLLLSKFCYSQDWKLLFEVEDGTYYYKPNTSETAWIKVVSNKTTYYPNKASTKLKTVDGYTIVLWKFNCEDRKLGLIQSNVYSKDGKLLDSIERNELLVDMRYVIPESIGEQMLTKFCVK